MVCFPIVLTCRTILVQDEGKETTMSEDSTTDASPEFSDAIPLYNEEKNVEKLVSELARELETAGIDYELVLVNNGSRDRTGEIIDRLAAGNARIRPIHFEENQGYGGGILAGLKACRGELIGYSWGDSQVRAEDLVRIFVKLKNEGLDLCKSRRIERHDGFLRRVVTTIYNGAFPLFFKTPTRDVNGCPKIFRKDRFLQMDIRSTDWFIDAEIMIKSGELNLRVGEVPVIFHAREQGSSNVNLGTVLEFVKNLVVYKFGRLRTVNL